MSSRLTQHWLDACKLIGWLVASLWLVELVNTLLNHRLNLFGIYPRAIETLPGILFWAFLHDDFRHLVMNTTPLFIMGYLVALRGAWVFLQTSLIILVVSGLGVWLFGRSAYHIGASGLVFGFFGFLVAVAIYERSIKTFFISCCILFYYGGLIFGILPKDDFVSWEGHLFGLIAGIIAARVLTIRASKV